MTKDSKVEFHIEIYVARGGKAFINKGTVENFFAGEAVADEKHDPVTEPKFIEATEVSNVPQLPRLLNNDQCRALLARMQTKNLLDARYQPINMTLPKMATLAREASMMLWGEQRWAPWSQLWGVPNFRNYYYRALEEKQNGDFAQKLRKMLME